MSKRFFLVATIISFVCASSSVVSAQSADVYDPHANYSQPSDVSASLYVRVPFNGGLKRASNEEARFGLALKTTLPQSFSYTANNYGYAFQGSAGPQIKILDLSVGPNGFKSFKLNNMSLNQINALYADEEEREEGMSKGTKILIGVGVTFAATMIIAFAVVDDKL